MPAPGQEETVRIVALDRDFHVQCYRCEVRALCSSVLACERPTINHSGHAPRRTAAKWPS